MVTARVGGAFGESCPPQRNPRLGAAHDNDDSFVHMLADYFMSLQEEPPCALQQNSSRMSQMGHKRTFSELWRCPLFLQKQISVECSGMSALGHNRTHAAQQNCGE